MIKFDESTHTYTYNGKVLPSVSTILGATIFKDKYKDVDPYILQRAAQFGTGVHKAIEIDDYFGLDDVQYTVFKRYKRLCKKHDIKPIVHEQIVYTDKYAGTLDMIAMIQSFNSLTDVKTTYHLDREYLSWQLSMYELAYMKLHNKPQFDKLYAIWLPKRKGAELVEIERKSEEQLKELIEVYYANHST
jgi:hypothetical protein